MPDNKNAANENERTPWDVFTKEDLEVLANLESFLEQQRELEKERLRYHRKIWDEALDQANCPEIFGYNVPIK